MIMEFHFLHHVLLENFLLPCDENLKFQNNTSYKTKYIIRSQVKSSKSLHDWYCIPHMISLENST